MAKIVLMSVGIFSAHFLLTSDNSVLNGLGVFVAFVAGCMAGLVVDDIREKYL